MSASAGRQIGVKIPDGQLSQGKAPEQTVTHAVKGDIYAIQYGDEYGKARTGIVFKFGDVHYLDPNGEQWAAKLRQAMPWVKEGIESKVADQTADVPNEDVVDVLGAAIAGEGAGANPSAT